MWLRVVTRFRAVINPTAGGFALGFLLSLSMLGAWRAVAGPVAEETTPVRVAGGSPLRRPLATWMLMRLAVNAGNLIEGYGFFRLRIQDSTGVLAVVKVGVSGILNRRGCYARIR